MFLPSFPWCHPTLPFSLCCYFSSPAFSVVLEDHGFWLCWLFLTLPYFPWIILLTTVTSLACLYCWCQIHASELHTHSCNAYHELWVSSHYPVLRHWLPRPTTWSSACTLLSFLSLKSNKLPSLMYYHQIYFFIHPAALSLWLLLWTRHSISCLNQWGNLFLGSRVWLCTIRIPLPRCFQSEFLTCTYDSRALVVLYHLKIWSLVLFHNIHWTFFHWLQNIYGSLAIASSPEPLYPFTSTYLCGHAYLSYESQLFLGKHLPPAPLSLATKTQVLLWSCPHCTCAHHYYCPSPHYL